MATKNVTTPTLEYLNEKAHYLYVVIRYYDEPKENLLSFYNEAKECLDGSKNFVPPMLNKEHKLLILLIDLKTLKVLDWNGGYLRMWGKQGGIRLLVGAVAETTETI